METYQSEKSDEIDEEGKIKILTQAFEELKKDPNYSNEIELFFNSFLNLNVEPKFSFGFDLVLAYDCLVEIFKTYVPSSISDVSYFSSSVSSQ